MAKEKMNATKKAIEEMICKSHTGKMSGFQSLSTNATMCANCNRNRKIKGSICEKCYAFKMLNRYKTLFAKLTRNTEFLTRETINPEDVPFINAALFRFEAFGDLHNTTQFGNYCTIAAANEHCRFVIWTKYPHVIADYIADGGVIPDNLSIIYSALMINQPIEKTLYFLRKTGYDSFVDGVFTVYDKTAIERDGVEINCGARSCASCRRCYTLEHGRIEIISEKLK